MEPYGSAGRQNGASRTGWGCGDQEEGLGPGGAEG